MRVHGMNTGRSPARWAPTTRPAATWINLRESAISLRVAAPPSSPASCRRGTMDLTATSGGPPRKSSRAGATLRPLSLNCLKSLPISALAKSALDGGVAGPGCCSISAEGQADRRRRRHCSGSPCVGLAVFAETASRNGEPALLASRQLDSPVLLVSGLQAVAAGPAWRAGVPRPVAGQPAPLAARADRLHGHIGDTVVRWMAPRAQQRMHHPPRAIGRLAVTSGFR